MAETIPIDPITGWEVWPLSWLENEGIKAERKNDTKRKWREENLAYARRGLAFANPSVPSSLYAAMCRRLGSRALYSKGEREVWFLEILTEARRSRWVPRHPLGAHDGGALLVGPLVTQRVYTKAS